MLLPITGNSVSHAATALKQIARVLSDHQQIEHAEAAVQHCLDIGPQQQDVILRSDVRASKHLYHRRVRRRYDLDDARREKARWQRFLHVLHGVLDARGDDLIALRSFTRVKRHKSY
jgi:hypothetical protein